MYTNVVSTFSAGTGGKESDAVSFTSDFSATSGKCEVHGNSSCAPNSSASTACSEEPPVVQSVCYAPVEIEVAMEVSANFSTQPTEVSTSVEEREDAAKAEQLLTTRSDNYKVWCSHLLRNVDTHYDKCENQAKDAGEGQSDGIQ